MKRKVFDLYDPDRPVISLTRKTVPPKVSKTTYLYQNSNKSTENRIQLSDLMITLLIIKVIDNLSEIDLSDLETESFRSFPYSFIQLFYDSQRHC